MSGWIHALIECFVRCTVVRDVYGPTKGTEGSVPKPQLLHDSGLSGQRGTGRSLSSNLWARHSYVHDTDASIHLSLQLAHLLCPVQRLCLVKLLSWCQGLVTYVYITEAQPGCDPPAVTEDFLQLHWLSVRHGHVCVLLPTVQHLRHDTSCLVMAHCMHGHG